MRYLKKEYVGVISWITCIGTRGGIKEYCVTYADGSEVDMLEHEIEKLFK